MGLNLLVFATASYMYRPVTRLQKLENQFCRVCMCVRAIKRYIRDEPFMLFGALYDDNNDNDDDQVTNTKVDSAIVCCV